MKANFFATSRPTPHIEKEFRRCIPLEILARDDDVHSYLDGHMSQLPAFVSRRPDLQKEIKMEITRAIEGVYVPAGS